MRLTNGKESTQPKDYEELSHRHDRKGHYVVRYLFQKRRPKTNTTSGWYQTHSTSSDHSDCMCTVNFVSFAGPAPKTMGVLSEAAITGSSDGPAIKLCVDVLSPSSGKRCDCTPIGPRDRGKRLVRTRSGVPAKTG
jgi:hypothetical protein